MDKYKNVKVYVTGVTNVSPVSGFLMVTASYKKWESLLSVVNNSREYVDTRKQNKTKKEIRNRNVSE